MIGKVNKKFKTDKLQLARARASHILANCNLPLNLSVITFGGFVHNRLFELADILTGLIGDLSIAVSVLKEYESKPEMRKPELAVRSQCIWRLCVNSIVINCCKYVELNRKFGQEFKNEIPELNKLRGQFNEKITKNKSIGILRDDYVAHVNSRSSKKCLTHAEVQNHILSMFGGTHASKFLDWVCPDHIEASNQHESLVGTIQLLKDAVVKKL